MLQKFRTWFQSGGAARKFPYRMNLRIISLSPSELGLPNNDPPQWDAPDYWRNV